LVSTSAGIKTLTATYEGDENFEGGFSTADHTVNRRETVTTVIGSETPLVVNVPAVFTVEVKDVAEGTPSIPTGTVEISVSPAGVGTLSTTTATLDESGRCTFTYTPTDGDTATHTITVVYSGDLEHEGSTGSYDQAVIKRKVDMEILLDPTTAYILQPVTITVKVWDDTTEGTPEVPQGEVTFDDGGKNGMFSADTVSLNNGECTVTYTPWPWDAGTTTITATYTGSSVHEGESRSIQLEVKLRPTEITVEGPTDALIVYEPGDFTVKVKDAAGVPGASAPGGTLTVTPSLSDAQITLTGVSAIDSTTSWTFTYMCTGLDADGGYDTLDIKYQATDGIHEDAEIGFAQAVTRRPTKTTLSDCYCTSDGVTCTVTVEDHPDNSGRGNPPNDPQGDFIAMYDEDGDGEVDEVDVGDATSATFSIASDLPLTNVTVKFEPSDRIYLKSTASENVDRTDCMPPPDPGDGTTGASCTDGCGSGGTNVDDRLLALSNSVTALESASLLLEATQLEIWPEPEPIVGAGFGVITGSTIPTVGIQEFIVGMLQLSIDAYILTVTTDTDGDGIPDIVEKSLGLDSNSSDTDDDGMGDAEEIDYAGGYMGGSRRPNPTVADSDGDGLMDGAEIAPYGTNVCVADSDCDTVPDGVEIAAHFSPTEDNGFDTSTFDNLGYSYSFPFSDPRDWPNPWEGDTDGDGLPDNIEFGPGRLATSISDPNYSPYVNDPDSDGDGLQDGAEDLNGDGRWEGTIGGTGVGAPSIGSGETHLCLADTDGDGLSDGEEVALFGAGSVHVITPYGTETNPALDTDSDDDGLSDYEEVNVTFTDPLNYDTDGDGIWDVNEFIAIGGAWPHRQFQQISDPLDPDTDDDGLPDNIEYDGTGLGTGHGLGGDPDTTCPYVNDADSDDDGLQDGYEDANRDGVITNSLGDSSSQGSGETSFCDPDTDDDGLLDGQEEGLFGQGAVTAHTASGDVTTVPALDDDSDNDGLSDYEEVNITQTDPLNWDTDGDGISDADELIATGGAWPKRTFEQESDPLDPDTDDDGLTDNVEYPGTGLGSTYLRGLGGDRDTVCPYVNDADSDDDGLQDGTESWDGDETITTGNIGDSTTQADVNPSGETDFCNPDTDGDGLTDGEEVNLLGGLPMSHSTGFTPVTPQGVSTQVGVDGPPLAPTIPALDDDSDNDGLSDYEEVNITGTDPLDADTDNDTISDADELIATGGTWPKRTFQQVSDPLDPDTDDDDLTDNIEYDGTGLGVSRTTGGVDDTVCPYVNNPDSDNDGLLDGTEDANHDGTWGVNGSGITVGGINSQAQKSVDYWETDLCNPDTDGDGLLDGEEVALLGGAPISGRPRPVPGFDTVTPEGRSTTLPVADYSGTGPLYTFNPTPGPDLDPTIPALDADSDNDGLSDYEEVNVTGTDPLDADSDNDTLMDADELIATGGSWPARTFDQESDPLDINTDDDYLPDPVEGSCGDPVYTGTGLSSLGGGLGGTRDTLCPYVNNADSDEDGVQDGAVIPISREGPNGFLYSYAFIEGFLDVAAADVQAPGTVRIVVTPATGEQNDDTICNVCDPDSDGDGLTDGEEVGLGTNPQDWDTDNDGRNDWHEVTGGGPIPTDPFDPDTDDDGLLDSAEVFGSNPTNPVNADTDGDGLCDGGAGTPYMVSGHPTVTVNPICKSCSTPGNAPCAVMDRSGSADGIGDHPNPMGLGEDENGNGAWDAGETDPNQYDTDGDAEGDGIEKLGFSTSRQDMIPATDLFGRPITVTYPSCGCLDPLNPDTDGDGLSDGYEDRNHDGNFDFLPSEFDHADPLPGPPIPYPTETNPCDPDTDHDGLTDYQERYQPNPASAFPFNPTNPLDHDTDNDYIYDGPEVEYVCTELLFDNLDDDGDGLIDEDPVDELDNDGDGYIDEDDANFTIIFVPVLDPTNRDSDSDGFIDGLDPDPCNSPLIPIVAPAGNIPVDTDGDSFADQDETIAGTDPLDPDSHPAAYTADLDLDEVEDDRLWLVTADQDCFAEVVVIDIDSNGLADARIQVIEARDFAQDDFNGDGVKDDAHYIVAYALAGRRVLQPRIVLTIYDYGCDLVIDKVEVEKD
jgi:hypothetical protein